MDPILYWNDVALEANKVSHSNGKMEQNGPPLSARALAIVHLAVYDAFAGASGNPANLPRYMPGLSSAPAGASIDAAAASAAHVTLSALFPSQKATFDGKLAAAPVTGTPTQIADGRAYGATVAQALLADRAQDPDEGNVGYISSMASGHHRVDPDNPEQGFHAPFYGEQARCFSTQTRFYLDKPPTPGDSDYRKAFRQVRIKGIAPELVGTIPPGGQKRTEEETRVGLFWAYDGAKGLGTPPRLYNRIIRQIAAAQGNGPAENARLFALVNVAMADAGILAWEQKYIHDLWRPVVGIRLDDQPGIPSEKDANWLPLGAPKTNEPGAKNFTPPFPAYPSGHATFGAAAFQITRLFYGVTANGPDKLAKGLTFVSEELNGVSTDNKGAVRALHSRTFKDGLWGMIRENSISRVFLGVHWVFDGYAPGPADSMDLSQNIGGVPLGIDIAESIFNGGRAAGLKKSNV
jgi:vanadium chloroperoxidase